MMDMDNEFVRKAMPLVRVPDGIHGILFQEIGKALWSIQFFEDALATYLAAVFKVSKGTAAHKAEKLLEDTRKSTAGTLLNDLRKKARISAKSDMLLTRLVSERNWLVHRLHHENGDDLYDERRFIRLINRIRNLNQNALNVQKEFGRLMMEWIKKNGVTQSQIDTATLSRLRAARQNRRTT